MTPPALIAVLGPTGSGKSDFAEALADRTGALLLNADAFQVYRGLDIGTNKPSRRSLYQLLDLVDPQESFGVVPWVQAALPLLEAAFAQGQSVILVGGTGFYVRALMDEFADLREAPDPELRAHLMAREEAEGLAALVAELEAQAPEVAAHTDLKNPVRVRRALERLQAPPAAPISIPPFRRRKVALLPDPEWLNERLAARTEHLLAEGWIEEVRGLLEQGVTKDAPGMRAIGYRNIVDHLQGEISLAELTDQINLATRQYAKRQRTWLRTEKGLVSYQGERAQWNPLVLGRDWEESFLKGAVEESHGEIY